MSAEDAIITSFNKRKKSAIDHEALKDAQDSFLLKVEDIKASYYKKEILRGLSLGVRREEIVSLIGPNGAGKSTLLKVIFGLLKPKDGRVIFDQTDVTGNRPYNNVRQGISYFIQGGEVFADLTVNENFRLGYFQEEETPFEERRNEVLEIFPDLKRFQTKRAGLLSGGERQMLALGMILTKRPKILLLDEPSAGLAPSLVKSLLSTIKEIKKRFHTSILLVEQNIKEALRISDRAYLLRAGRIEVEGTSENILRCKEIEEVFFA